MGEILAYPFMQRALIAAVIIGPLCAFLGVFVILRQMAFFSDAIAHAALTGIALGLLLQIHPMAVLVVFSLLVAAAIVFTSERTTLPQDTVIGVYFSGALAFGVLVLNAMEGYPIDLFAFLFGDILVVGPLDLFIMAALAIGVVAVVMSRLRVFVLLTLSPDLARAEGLPVRAYHYIFVGLLALVVTAGLKIVGVILVSALIVIPAAAARNLAQTFSAMLALSAALGLASSLAGVVTSFHFDTPTGPTIVMVSIAIFAASCLWPQRVARA
ncbi:MAG: metal ABC transporter permease [bacterium]|nr:metal ABC transporter permease [bacterium]